MTNEYAIEILEQRKCCRECVADCTCDECDEAFDMAIKALEKTAKWIYKNDKETGIEGLHCSNCGFAQAQIYIKYCGNCGARMKAESEEEE